MTERLVNLAVGALLLLVVLILPASPDGWETAIAKGIAGLGAGVLIGRALQDRQ